MPDRILVVDDSPTQLQAARELLENRGFDVSAARTGDDALELVREQSFDLVLTDVVMPGISGYELCSRIKLEASEPPAVVLLTSLADPRDIVRGVECGADNYITKPYAGDQLVTRIRHVIDNYRLRGRTAPEGPVTISFLGETYSIRSDPAQILALLLSSFEELIRTNDQLQENRRELAQAHARELKREQEARAQAEADTRRMESLKQKAEAAIRIRDDVLATVSHDLKNPLGTIYTSATLLLDIPLDDAGRHRQLEIIRRTAERMDRLIQDLLDVSKMEAGQFTVDPAPEQAASLVQEAVELMSTFAEASEIRLTADELQTNALVLADRNRVLQVFSNLIGNAIKFTPAGGSVTIGAVECAGGVRFSVADSGVGIPEENLPHIFDRFWQSGAGAGSGLGLAIVKAIVEAHGGTITAESSGRGTTFTFDLPTAS